MRCGEGLEDITALVCLNATKARAISGMAEATLAQLAGHAAVRAAAQHTLARAATGQPVTRRVARLILLPQAPSLEDGEITDKGYLNQANCRARRQDVIDALYGAGDQSQVIRI